MKKGGKKSILTCELPAVTSRWKEEKENVLITRRTFSSTNQSRHPFSLGPDPAVLSYTLALET
jgi:hypothetical protein